MNGKRLRRHISNDRNCPRCATLCESGIHIVQDCPFSKADKGHYGSKDFEWQPIFSIICWLLWKNRNHFVSYGQRVIQLPVPICLSHPMVTNYHWSPPKDGWIKLNMDGAVPSNNANASIGGVLRDSNVMWLCGYTMLLGKELMWQCVVG
ncbi:Non-LTR retroelement reverse transcriptase [Gossypium australe]|uniref:Non-LTR retroelement reverse transcriptase n=1 Tax=Gossypium australe TaxID=47621 RepID=A0A5B6VAG5_9ROSI|nr:Non-LTR retroelement reverse transcriptase [Gossypium australe]